MSDSNKAAQNSAQNLFLHDPDGQEPSLDFVEYWRTLRKHKWAILSFALVVTLVAGVVAFVTTPIYEAKTTLLIETAKQKVVSIEDVYSGMVPAASISRPRLKLSNRVKWPSKPLAS